MADANFSDEPYTIEKGCVWIINNISTEKARLVSWGHIFSRVWPFYEWAVSDLDP